MKYSTWIFGLIAALSLQVHAESLSLLQQKLDQQLKEKHVTGNIKLSDSPVANPPPIRQAAARVRVVKVVLTPNSSGGYDSQEIDVCNTATTLNVYDIRHSGTLSVGSADADRLQCHSTLLGQPTTVHIGGVLALMNQNLFGVDQDFKMSIPVMTYDVPTGQPNSDSVMGIAAISGSTDMNARSLLSQLVVMNLIACQNSSSSGNGSTPNPPGGGNSTTPPGSGSSSSGSSGCIPSINEYFTAVIDVQD